MLVAHRGARAALQRVDPRGQLRDVAASPFGTGQRLLHTLNLGAQGGQLARHPERVPSSSGQAPRRLRRRCRPRARPASCVTSSAPPPHPVVRLWAVRRPGILLRPRSGRWAAPPSGDAPVGGRPGAGELAALASAPDEAAAWRAEPGASRSGRRGCPGRLRAQTLGFAASLAWTWPPSCLPLPMQDDRAALRCLRATWAGHLAFPPCCAPWTCLADEG